MNSIKRFGNYYLDLKRPPEPWVKESQFREVAKREKIAADEGRRALKIVGQADRRD